MANVYYKDNNKYQLLTFREIEAAALKHNHAISDMGIMNFKDNGCFGQNILQNFDSEHWELLFYVPQSDSTMVYAKRIPQTLRANATIVPYYDIVTQTNTISATSEPISLNMDHTTAYEYNNFNNIISEYSVTAIENYYCCAYPLQIGYNDINFISNQDYITITFETNLPLIYNDNEDIDENELKIAFSPIVENNIITGYRINNTVFPKIGYTNIINIGLICTNKNIIDGFCVLFEKPPIYQLEITNIKITSTQNIYWKQSYSDYFHIAETGIPPIQFGSLGEVPITVTRSEESMLRYYCSEKFKTLLLPTKELTIAGSAFSGYCDNISDNNKRGYFILSIPQLIDENITTDQIQLIGKAAVWGCEAHTDYLDLAKNNTVSQNKINYQIDLINSKAGKIFIYVFFYHTSTNFKLSTPLYLFIETTLKLQITDNTNN